MTFSTKIRQFAQKEDGTILVFWAMALVVVLGFVALSLDVGRLATTQSELQSFADHVALAAAGELDGQNDAITRATAAAANLITDTQTYGNGGQTLGGSADYTLDFYATLPGNDATALPSPNPSPPQPEDAVYVQVTVNPKTVDFPFGSLLSTLLGGTTVTPSTSASAVAGFTQYACDIAPMMFCIPDPTFDASDPARVGDMIRLRSGGQGAAWGPGNFGFLDPTQVIDANGNCASVPSGPQKLACVLAAAGSITQCVAQRGVDTEPGQKVGITNVSLNMRFDMWPQSMHNKEMIDPVFAPAPNVIKGVKAKGGACKWNGSDPTGDTAALPRDDCFPGCAPYGDGNWSGGRTDPVNGYVAKNYGGNDPHLTASTRYEYYLAEIAAAGGPFSTSSILNSPPLSETGRRMCSPNQYPDPERRVMIIAGVNCDPLNGGMTINGNTVGVPVKQFVKVFITEPVQDNGASPAALDMYVEVIGSAHSGSSGGNSGVIHDVVQLYR
ncbi:pilus assembly protein TadG-related protein [Defluviimonas aestuarii]|uniref:TadE/TadG family type IV pilus assembly protein n=1 Tax=Albidovulum aestuarii TaxID=1130726 RepID=UPI00249C08D5|nr:pilus assembly protein TadG-related protein [Defluviimonas aestuarii]MDI3334884.1 pilus assembly protein TadG-related protein [Defluviimonas aestuarii]